MGLAIGAQHGDFDAVSGGFLSDRANWDLAGRPSFGVDFHVTDHLVLNTEVAGSLSVRDRQFPGLDETDMFYLSVGGGLHYRF